LWSTPRTGLKEGLWKRGLRRRDFEGDASEKTPNGSLLEELLAHNIALASRLAQELESRTPNSEK
jgi:hypothetical protein